MRPAIFAIFMLGLCGLGLAQKVRFNPLDKSEMVDRVRKEPQNDRDRVTQLESWFRIHGCGGSSFHEQQVSDSQAPNLICDLNGDAEETIIIGAHYGMPPANQHAIDDWSSASLLPALYQCLKGVKRRHHFIFVEFGDAGTEAGAEYFLVHRSDAEIRNTEAVINLDALGFSPTKVWASHSDKDLVHSLMIMVYALKLPASQVDISSLEADQTQPFSQRKIPQITLHSFAKSHVEGTSGMQFRPGNFYDSYKLLCGYTAYLDTTLKRAHGE